MPAHRSSTEQHPSALAPPRRRAARCFADGGGAAAHRNDTRAPAHSQGKPAERNARPIACGKPETSQLFHGSIEVA